MNIKTHREEARLIRHGGDASFEIKFINIKYMQMGSGALEMRLCSRRDDCLWQPNTGN
jgi:hypothetical protein